MFKKRGRKRELEKGTLNERDRVEYQYSYMYSSYSYCILPEVVSDIER